MPSRNLTISRAHRSRRIARAVSLETLEARRLLASSSIVYPGADGRLIYTPTAVGDRVPDFSMVGYKTGNVPLPNTTGGVSVPVKQTINPGAAGVDMTATIQSAINAVSAMSTDANGFRGAVLLTAGNYPISGTLTINASGVVLMGVGDSSTTGTRIEGTGTATRFLISVDGSGSRSTSGSTYTISDSYVPVGATSFHVTSASGLAVGDNILVNRPSPANWIHDIGMDLLDNPWTPGSKDQNWERVITGISGNTITIDVPLTNSLDVQYGGGTFKHYSFSGRINQVGISDMYLYSDGNVQDNLNHATGSITMDRTTNGWIHNVTSDGFAVNQIIFSGNAKYCTLDDAIVQNTTVSTQAPPAGVSVNGPLNLVENVVEHGVYHAVALGAQVPGPNVITNLSADGIGSDCGPHQRWSTGGLFDDTTIVGNDLQAFNRGNSGTGHGWAGANYVFWNCSARNLEIDNPPTAQNWAIGCIGNKSNNGTFDSLGVPVFPTSLYQKQLWDRTHQNPTVATAASANPNPRSGSTTNLSVLGGYNLGESNLAYTWSCVSKPGGAADPTYSVNGTNGAKNTVATFSAAGAYVFQVTISDQGGLLVTSSVIVTDRPTTPVNGDATNETFRVTLNGSFVDVTRNNVNVLHQDYGSSPMLAINAGGGNDTIIVDYTNGNPIPSNGLIIDGGSSGNDVVSVIGTAGNDAVTLSTGNVQVNAGGASGSFGYAGAEELDLALGAGGDTLSVAGNSAVTAPAFVLNVAGGGTLSMAASSMLPDFADLNVNGATFNLNGQNETIDALNGNGTVSNGASGSSITLTVGNKGASASFSGTIANGLGTLSLTKIGAGKLTLSGNNSYSGLSTIAGGVIESGNSASFAALAGQVRFNGGTFHVTADTTANNLSSKFTTSFSGATSASTGTFDIDAGVTLMIGGASACLQTNGGGSHGGVFFKKGLGTLRILSNNGQLDDPFHLDAGTVIVESATGLGGADNSSNHVDMKTGTTLVLKQSTATNFLTPINIVDTAATINVVIDRGAAGAGVTHSVNALTSVGDFTLNLSAGANVTGGTQGLSVGTVTLAGNGTFNVGANASMTVTGAVNGAFNISKSGVGSLVFNQSLTTSPAISITGGTLKLASSGSTHLIKTSSLSITGSGKLDLTDNKLIVPGGTLGTWNGSAYTGITGLIQSGAILTSQSAATNGNHLTTLGVATADQIGGVGTVWGGQTLAAGDVLVMYTYAGDANLDGRINGDDYAQIDGSFPQPLHGYFAGDFNFDGVIDGDDYFLIDSNFPGQGPAIPT